MGEVTIKHLVRYDRPVDFGNGFATREFDGPESETEAREFAKRKKEAGKNPVIIEVQSHVIWDSSCE